MPPRTATRHGLCSRNVLLILTFVGVLTGIFLGFVLHHTVKDTKTRKNVARLVGFPGAIFMQVLNMTIIPIIISSLVSAAANLRSRATGVMAFRTLTLFLVSTFVSALVALGVALVIAPGNSAFDGYGGHRYGGRGSLGDGVRVNILDAVLDVIRNAFPENLVLATVAHVHTVYSPVENELLFRNETDTQEIIYKPELRIIRQLNAIGLITFCLAFGAVLGSLGERGKLMRDFFKALDLAFTRIIRIFIWVSPTGIPCLICERISVCGDIFVLLYTLGWLIFAVVVALGIHQFVLLPTLYLLVMRKNPYSFAVNCGQAWLTAFALSSSAVALPITFRSMRRYNRVNVQVLRLVLPTGAMINMDGTVIFLVVASIFLAQLSKVTIHLSSYITFIFVACAGSIATAAIPSASLAIMHIVISALGLSSDHISILFAVDWLLDRCRTTSNIMSDCYMAAIIERWSKNDLRRQAELQEN